MSKHSMTEPSSSRPPMRRTRLIWGLWILLTLACVAFLGYQMLLASQKPAFLIGEATDGHHQIELSCETCHTTPFGGPELIQQACLGCHSEELKMAHDSHPLKKFTDPRNADRVARLDARNCVTCHNEHQREQTRAMGVTLPEDYCFECHQDIATERPSHTGMAFNTCASAGCHNYHDNRALYEEFLLAKHENPMIQAMAKVLERSGTRMLEKRPALTQAAADTPHIAVEITEHWSTSSHAKSGVNCSSCHQDSDTRDWIEQPGIGACQSCHSAEQQGFMTGKHGMKAAAGLGLMTPAQGRLPFYPDADNTGLDCASCHDPHAPDLKLAAVEACIGCHADEHSRQYKESPHYVLWQQELAGTLPAGSGVSCATCHLPREVHPDDPQKWVRVQHNQNLNLRPNEKMIRGVCMDCHTLAFSIDALADQVLVQNNFRGLPAEHILSIDMALERDKRSH